MVPKTGSTVLVAAFSRFLKCRGDAHSPFHVNFHPQSYRPCSLATLRDPCERIVSQFDHLKNSYHWAGVHGYNDDPKHCVKPAPLSWDSKPAAHNASAILNESRAAWLYTPHCRSHWLHRTLTVETFVSQLRSHWASEILQLEPKKAASSGPIRHMVITLPQHLWIGNESFIICNKRITTDVPRVASHFSSCEPDFAAAQDWSDGSHLAHFNISGKTVLTHGSNAWPVLPSVYTLCSH